MDKLDIAALQQAYEEAQVNLYRQTDVERVLQFNRYSTNNWACPCRCTVQWRVQPLYCTINYLCTLEISVYERDKNRISYEFA